MTTPQSHGDTEAPLTGFDAVLNSMFVWVQDNIRSIAAVFGVLFVTGLLVVFVLESRKSAEEAGQTALMQTQLDLSQAMGASPGAVVIEEPANEEVALAAREAALASYAALMDEYEGSDAAIIAGIRSAQLEIELGRLEAADTRLTELTRTLGANDARRAVALRLKGYTQEQRGLDTEAGETYLEAATVESYPAMPLVLLSAAKSFERAGSYQRAITTYERVLAASPEVAEQESVVARMRLAEARAGWSQPPTSSPPATQEEGG